MKYIILSIFAVFGGLSMQAQITNPGFESIENGIASGWKYKAGNPYQIKADSSTSHSGSRSLTISAENATSDQVQTFSQRVSVPGKGLRNIELSTYIKSENINGDIIFWNQVRKDEKTMIDFANSSMQNKIMVNTDWKKYTLEFTVDDDTQYFVMGGLLSGSGKVWFDDFAVTEVPFSTIPSSKIALDYINEFKNIVKKNSIYKEKIDWKLLDANLQKISMNMQTAEDTTPALQYILKALKNVGDNHSFIDNKEKAEQKRTSNFIGKEPESKLIDQNIGYVMVPAYSSVNKEVGNAFAEKIQQMIKKLDSENSVKGWIVDLRTNTGGNMYPMIVGLGPLIGNGILGYFTDGSKKKSWKYQDGKSYDIKVPNPYSIKNPNQKIAVLIGPRTASSGEATAISFIGKSNVKTFGQPSAGYTSANQDYQLSDGKTFHLAASFEMDRNGKEYTEKIQPDYPVESIKESNTDADILSASKWILE
ncbi:S41 family peptidase [Chryseobacterium sp. MYb264]|uniref:S41 family peptidase n=1 Tax=Chryseobacterium sp. MYb264 TaxID=2745153 RepID=UPI002E0D4DA1|nr:S41 family peptidase [Chryseobacterium sp. MYb264]